MGAILDVVLPVFSIMLAGYLAGRFRLLGEASSEALNGFVYYAAMPALFLVSMAQVDLAQVFDGPFLLAYGGAMAATFALAVGVAAFVFPNRLGALTLHGLSSIMTNSGYLGIPLLLTAYGEAALPPAIIATVFNGTVLMAGGAIILELDLGRERDGPGVGLARRLGRVALGILRNPMVMAAFVGILVNALGLKLPVPLETFCDILGAAAAPCALFAIGLFMVGRSFTAGALEVGWLVSLKLLVQPIVAWWLAYRVLEMEPVWAASTVVLSALPTGAIVFMLSQRYGIYTQRSTAAIMVSTVVSVASLSLLFQML